MKLKLRKITNAFILDSETFFKKLIPLLRGVFLSLKYWPFTATICGDFVKIKNLIDFS
jgi:hypothetical protein